MSRATSQPGGRNDMRSFAATLTRDQPRLLLWVSAVQILSSISQAAGLLLLVPLLQLAGVGGAAGSRFWKSLFKALGLKPTLGAALVVYIMVVALSAGFSAYSTVLQTRFRLEFVDRLRNRLYRAVAAAEWRHLLDLRQSDLLNTLSVSVGFVAVGTMAALATAVAASLLLFQLAVALRISPAVTGIACATGGVMLAVLWPFLRKGRQLGRQLVEGNRAILASVTGFLDGLKLAKAHGLETSHLATFDQAMTGARRSQIRFARASAVSTALQLTMTAIVLAVIVEISVQVLHLQLTSLLVLAFVFSRIVQQIVSMQQGMLNFAQAAPSFGDVIEVIDTCEAAVQAPSEITDRRIPLGHAIELAHVTFSFGGAMVLDDVTVSIPARQVTALVGRSGAGKTTLADLVIGLLEPASGRIDVGGITLDRDSATAWRNSIALVPQDPFLFHDTIRANLTWAKPDAAEDDLWHALDRASAKTFVERLPNALDTVVGDRGGRLSGGERQRIAIARALLRGPELLVLDEATSSLDTENETAIRQAIAAMRGETTVVVIAHRLSSAAIADHVVVLEQGRVVEQGTWDDLAGRRGTLRTLIDAGTIG